MLKISIESKKKELFMKSISRELWIEIEKIFPAKKQQLEDLNLIDIKNF